MNEQSVHYPGMVTKMIWNSTLSLFYGEWWSSTRGLVYQFAMLLIERKACNLEELDDITQSYADFKERLLETAGLSVREAGRQLFQMEGSNH